MEAMIEGVRKIALTKTVSETVQHVRGLKEATTAQDQMAIVFMAFFHEEPEVSLLVISQFRHELGLGL